VDPNTAPRRVIVKAKNGEEEPDWDQEMSIFQKRISRPNQLATLRELEGKVNVGKVLYCKDNLAIISGLNADAPIGTKLTFVTGGTGVLLWHRSDDIAFALILGGASMITVGEGVECKIKGVLQVVDDAKGPITRKDYEEFRVPAGEALFGRVVSFLGLEIEAAAGASTSAPAPAASSPPAPFSRLPQGIDKMRALITQQVTMKGREQISESLLTGIKGLDVLTPLGRGASLLLIGPRGSGKTTAALDAMIAQRKSGVKSVYAAIGQTEEQLRELMRKLEASGAAQSTVVVAAAAGAPLGEQYAAICTACTIGERIRDEGGHSLVIFDTLKPLVDVWEVLLQGLAQLDMARVGLIKDAEGRDISMPDPQGEQELVEYEGMLVSGAVAQRRGFFSTLFLRAAKLHRRAGGGSMTLMPVVPGRPATGVSKRVDMSKYQTLSEEQKAKIKAVLEKKLAEELAKDVAEGEMRTEAVEEFISIADGQLVLEDRPSPTSSYIFNPKLSVTRIGTRAYYKALETLAPQIRLDLAQAEDARKFAVSASDPMLKKYDSYAQRIQAALLQQPGQPTPLEELIVIILAVQKGFTDSVAVEQVPSFLAGAVAAVRAAAPSALEEIASTKLVTAAAEKAITDTLRAYAKQPTQARS